MAEISPAPRSALDGQSRCDSNQAQDYRMGNVADNSGLGPEAVRGITTYASLEGPGWSGVLRTRWSDFQVFEIDSEGKSVHLHDCQVPKQQVEAVVDGDNESASASQVANENSLQLDAPPPEITSADVGEIKDLAGEAFANQLIELYETGLGGLKAPGALYKVRSDPIDDKDKRRKVHEEIRRVFKSRLDTKATDQFAIQAVFWGRSRRKQRRGEDRERRNGQYLHFTLYKENRATMEIIQKIAQLLHIPPSCIAISGTKDRRGITTQRCSIRNMAAWRVANLNGRIMGVRLGDFEYRNERLWLGSNVGNEFVITLKDCLTPLDRPEHSIAERVENMRLCIEPGLTATATRGFINYYGLQRFGTYPVGTHEIGKQLLRGDPSAAIALILQYDPHLASLPAAPLSLDVYKRACALKMFDDGDVAGALALLPSRYSTEATLMRHLSATPNSRSVMNTISILPRNVRTFYLHAYQSFVWNHAASYRWTHCGPSVVEGDLVIEPAPAPEIRPPPFTPIESPDQDLEGDLSLSQDVRVLTADDAASGRYAIADVVLPIPGHGVLYPTNALGIFYEEFMGRPENGSLDPRAMHRRQRDYSLKGGYRRLLATFLSPPSYKICLYSRDEEHLHLSDLDLLRQRDMDPAAATASKRPRSHDRTPPKAAPKKARLSEQGSQPGCNGDGDGDGDYQGAEQDTALAEAGAEPHTPDLGHEPQACAEAGDADKVAVVLSFQLAKSAYATVALRELMRGKEPVD